MCYSSHLRESLHSLSYLYYDVSIVKISFDILFFQKLLWYHGYLYHDIFCPISHFVQVKIFHVHAHVSWFDVWDGAVNIDFHGGQVWCWCDDFSRIVYKIYSFSDSCSMSICFLRSDIEYIYNIGWTSILQFVFVENEIYCVSSCTFFCNPGIDGQVRCKLSWSILVHPSWIGLCTLTFTINSAVNVV